MITDSAVTSCSHRVPFRLAGVEVGEEGVQPVSTSGMGDAILGALDASL